MRVLLYAATVILNWEQCADCGDFLVFRKVAGWKAQNCQSLQTARRGKECEEVKTRRRRSTLLAREEVVGRGSS